MKTGVNTSTIIDFRKQRSDYFKKGKANCTKCINFRYGYYCIKLNSSVEHATKQKHCKQFKSSK